MLPRLLGEGIELILNCDPNLGRVKADQSQIEQMLMHLAVNARDAMPDDGKLTIETSNATLDESYTSRHPEFRAGAYVQMAVSDTGTDMDSETMAHMCEPFFTTKDPGKGTGLGLATIYGIVKQSGGWVRVLASQAEGPHSRCTCRAWM